MCQQNWARNLKANVIVTNSSQWNYAICSLVVGSLVVVNGITYFSYFSFPLVYNTSYKRAVAITDEEKKLAKTGKRYTEI